MSEPNPESSPLPEASLSPRLLDTFGKVAEKVFLPTAYNVRDLYKDNVALATIALPGYLATGFELAGAVGTSLYVLGAQDDARVAGLYAFGRVLGLLTEGVGRIAPGVLREENKYRE